MPEYLVKIGIDLMSLNPDTVLATTQRVLAVEEAVGRV
jgi:pyruvate,water dikinase